MQKIINTNLADAWHPGLMVEVSIEEPDDFLKIKETLTRIGFQPKNEKNKLIQSCHILHKRGRYYITHFKELFLLDGKRTQLTEYDIRRRDRIVMMLEEWGLLTIVNKEIINKESTHLVNDIKIIPFKEKDKWTLLANYTIGGNYT